MRLLALDLGATLGVAVGDVDAAPTCLHVKMEGTQSAKFLAMYHTVKSLIEEHRPDHVSIEKAIAYGPAGKEARVEMLMGYRAVVLMCLHVLGYRPPLEVSVSTARSEFLGRKPPKGKGKQMVFERCGRIGWDVSNLDESDACAVWAVARRKLANKFMPVPEGLFDNANHIDSKPPG